MIVFYSDNIQNDIGQLEGEDAKHCYKVLRKKVGDQITVLDGEGSICTCQILSIAKYSVSFEVKEREDHNYDPFLPSIGISLLKNQGRLEWFLEKATEIGVGAFYPIHCHRTLKGRFRKERAEAIITSAVKQSMRAWKPTLHDDKSFDEIIRLIESPQKFICHFKEGNSHLYEALDQNRESFILVGPEGDFTDAELELAYEYGWKEVNISNSRLRTETAGITVCQIVALKVI